MHIQHVVRRKANCTLASTMLGTTCILFSLMRLEEDLRQYIGISEKWKYTLEVKKWTTLIGIEH